MTYEAGISTTTLLLQMRLREINQLVIGTDQAKHIHPGLSAWTLKSSARLPSYDFFVTNSGFKTLP